MLDLLLFMGVIYGKPIQPTAQYQSIETKIEIPISREERAIQGFLGKKQSDLNSEAKAFVDSARRYKLDPYLLVAIAGKESGFGKHECGNHNSWGYGNPCWDFESYKEAIEKIAKTIGTGRAYHRFQETGEIGDLGPVYNKPQGFEDWVKDVKFFIKEIKNGES